MKIPQEATQHELQLAFGEGQQSYHDGRRRSYNPYIGKTEELADAWWEGWDTAKASSNKRAVRRILYIPARVAYHVWAEISDVVQRYRHRNDPPLPPAPCPLCGKPGHKAKYCPNAKDLGL
jgi:hypothetical protein